MALMRMPTYAGGDGNPITFDDLSVVDKTVLTTITTAGASWTATEDCVLGGIIQGSQSAAAYLYLNSVVVFSTVGKCGFAVSNSDATIPSTYGLFIPKGTEVKTRAYGTYNLKIYSLK